MQQQHSFDIVLLEMVHSSFNICCYYTVTLSAHLFRLYIRVRAQQSWRRKWSVFPFEMGRHAQLHLDIPLLWSTLCSVNLAILPDENVRDDDNDLWSGRSRGESDQERGSLKQSPRLELQWKAVLEVQESVQRHQSVYLYWLNFLSLPICTICMRPLYNVHICRTIHKLQGVFWHHTFC